MVRIFLWLTGFGLSVSGGISVIAYLNLLTAGYSLQEYMIFISGRIECYFLPVGLFMIFCSLYFRFEQY